jgi:hypothetical protein
MEPVSEPRARPEAPPRGPHTEVLRGGSRARNSAASTRPPRAGHRRATRQGTPALELHHCCASTTTASAHTAHSATRRRSGSRAGSARLDSMKVRALRRRSPRRRDRATISTAHLRRRPDFGGRPTRLPPRRSGSGNAILLYRRCHVTLSYTEDMDWEPLAPVRHQPSPVRYRDASERYKGAGRDRKVCPATRHSGRSHITVQPRCLPPAASVVQPPIRPIA